MNKLAQMIGTANRLATQSPKPDDVLAWLGGDHQKLFAFLASMNSKLRELVRTVPCYCVNADITQGAQFEMVMDGLGLELDWIVPQ